MYRKNVDQSSDILINRLKFAACVRLGFMIHCLDPILQFKGYMLVDYRTNKRGGRGSHVYIQ